jgi:hypothetical protein
LPCRQLLGEDFREEADKRGPMLVPSAGVLVHMVDIGDSFV